MGEEEEDRHPCAVSIVPDLAHFVPVGDDGDGEPVLWEVDPVLIVPPCGGVDRA